MKMFSKTDEVKTIVTIEDSNRPFLLILSNYNKVKRKGDI